jgi:hypothetical protein
MDRIRHSTAVADLPAYVDNGADPGYFQDENLSLGQEGTIVAARWLNQIQEELVAVIVAGGGTPNPSSLNQVATAINALIATALSPYASSAALTAEATARADADTTLQGNITAEATARADADTTLQGNITAEATARADADTTLQGNITAEATARADADTALDVRVSVVEGTGSAADNITHPGGAIIKSGENVTDVNGDVSITYGSAFPGGWTSIQITPSGAPVVAYYVANETVSGFDVKMRNLDGSNAAGHAFWWSATGS